MSDFFKKRRETAVFHLPVTGEETRQIIEYREDPLTGRTSVIGEGLLKKMTILFGETDETLVQMLADESRKNCFFCPPAVHTATPTYPHSLCPDGRMSGESSMLFPNLFPLAELHTVLCWPEHHFLRPSEFNQKLLSDLFCLTHDFLIPVRETMPEIRFLSLNCNYMPPAGASVLHPHFQLLGTKVPAHWHREVIEAAVAWNDRHGSCYWDDLTQQEQATGERWVGQVGSWSWMTAWSPLGSNEVMGVHQTASTLFDLKPNDWTALATGVHAVLSEYDSRKTSSFNICLTGGCCDTLEGQRCVIRIISRQNVKPVYRNDEYFLQKLHGIELIVSPPEDLADDLRKWFS